MFSTNHWPRFFRNFSPVVNASTIRIVFTLVVSRNWDISKIDINNAFLNDGHHEMYSCLNRKDLWILQSLPMFVNPVKPCMV